MTKKPKKSKPVAKKAPKKIVKAVKKPTKSVKPTQKQITKKVVNVADTCYYNNSLDEPVWLNTSMTRVGAISMAKTFRDKFGCTILEQPIERKDGCWVIMFTNPFLEA